MPEIGAARRYATPRHARRRDCNTFRGCKACLRSGFVALCCCCAVKPNISLLASSATGPPPAMEEAGRGRRDIGKYLAVKGVGVRRFNHSRCTANTRGSSSPRRAAPCRAPGRWPRRAVLTPALRARSHRCRGAAQGARAPWERIGAGRGTPWGRGREDQAVWQCQREGRGG